MNLNVNVRTKIFFSQYGRSEFLPDLHVVAKYNLSLFEITRDIKFVLPLSNLVFAILYAYFYSLL